MNDCERWAELRRRFRNGDSGVYWRAFASPDYCSCPICQDVKRQWEAQAGQWEPLLKQIEEGDKQE